MSFNRKKEDRKKRRVNKGESNKRLEEPARNNERQKLKMGTLDV